MVQQLINENEHLRGMVEEQKFKIEDLMMQLMRKTAAPVKKTAPQRQMQHAPTKFAETAKRLDDSFLPTANWEAQSQRDTMIEDWRDRQREKKRQKIKKAVLEDNPLVEELEAITIANQQHLGSSPWESETGEEASAQASEHAPEEEEQNDE